LPYLKSKGIRKLDYCILTHPDEDHKSGLIEIIKSDYAIDNLILPEIGIEDEAYAELEQLAREAGIQVMYISKGNVIKEDELEMECLHPYQDYVPESRNDYSTVLSMSVGKLDILFTGDIEAKGEEEITKLLKKDYDILKVAHHGSKKSTSMEFLGKVKAEYAIISCGENNRYGHPHQELLERLEEEDMEILNTKDVGAITIRVKGEWLEYSGYKEE
jgi:competence protein ComEC